jgi:hypothetical protein
MSYDIQETSDERLEVQGVKGDQAQGEDRERADNLKIAPD